MSFISVSDACYVYIPVVKVFTVLRLPIENAMRELLFPYAQATEYIIRSFYRIYI